MDLPEVPREHDERKQPAEDESTAGDDWLDERTEVDEASARAVQDCLRLLDEVWPGDTLDAVDMPHELGRFRIQGELGRGGFGVVFLAEDSLSGRLVALKVPRVEILTGSESWRRFLREVRAASRLDHPNLVPLLEAGAVGPVGYIISAYIPGPSLEQWLGGHPDPPQPRWAARIVAALARAIQHVHDRGILHRDLKPANVLLHAPGLSLDPAAPATWSEVPFDSWVPRICDFGLAKLHEIEEEETRSRMVCGSPPYMAPEQADSRRDQIGPATDIYGLGAILYELLAGRPPFGGKSNLETLRRVVSEEPVPPRCRRPGIPRDLDTICLKCLAKRPERRYATASELAGDLERFLEGRPIAARRTRAWERAARWARRNPTEALLASAVALALLAGLFGLARHEAVLRRKNEELRSEALRSRLHAQDADAQRGRADREALLLRRQLAGSRVFQAQQAVSSGNLELARTLLRITEPLFGARGAAAFPWSYLEESVRDRIEVLAGHRGEVGCLALSSDGRTLASGDDRGEIRLWDLEGGICRLVLTVPPRPLGHLAWSPDGSALASADRDMGDVRLWDGSSGHPLGRLAHTGDREPVWQLTFDGDGRSITAIRSRRDRTSSPITRWDITRPTGEFPEIPGEYPGHPLDGRLERIVDLLDSGRSSGSAGPAGADGREPRTHHPGVAFTDDHAMAVVSVGDDLFAVFRDGTRFRLALVFMRGDEKAVVSFDQFRVEDSPSRAERERLEHLAKALVPGRAKDGSPKASILTAEGSATTTPGPQDGQIVLWNEARDRLSLIDLRDGRENRISELGPLAGVRALAFDASRTTLALGSEDGRVRLWHRNPPGRVITLPGHAPKEAWSVAFSADGGTLASGGDDHLIRLWDVAGRRIKATLSGHDSMVTSLAFSPDGRKLASGSFDLERPVMLWDVETGQPERVLRGHRGRVRSVAFSPDGLTLASSGDDDTMLLWDAYDGGCRATFPVGHSPGRCYVSFGPDGRTIAASAGHRFDLVELATHRTRSIPLDVEVGPLVFSHDGSRLIAGLGDGSILTWDLVEGRPAERTSCHAGLVLGLAHSHDGRVLASAGVDQTVRLRDVETGQELLCLTECHARVNSIAFSRDGKLLAAADHSGAVTIWDARPRH